MNNTTPSQTLRAALIGALLVTAHAVAEPVPDPTRPMGLADTEARPVRAARSASAPAAVQAPLPKLQSIQVLAGQGGSNALVDGRLVRVGDRLGEFNVTAIDRNGLTLLGPRGEQRLPLLTGVTQTASRAEPPPADLQANGSPQDNKP